MRNAPWLLSLEQLRPITGRFRALSSPNLNTTPRAPPARPAPDREVSLNGFVPSRAGNHRVEVPGRRLAGLSLFHCLLQAPSFRSVFCCHDAQHGALCECLRVPVCTRTCVCLSCLGVKNSTPEARPSSCILTPQHFPSSAPPFPHCRPSGMGSGESRGGQVSGRGALNWRQQWQQVLVSRAISLGADGRPDGRTAVTLLYPVESQVALRQTPDAGLHPQKSCYNWSGVSPGDPYPRDSHAPVIKAENCHLVHFSDFGWVCASLDGSHTVLLSCA